MGLQSRRSRSGEGLQSALHLGVLPYDSTSQSGLGGRSPALVLKGWHERKPALNGKHPCRRAGFDRLAPDRLEGRPELCRATFPRFGKAERSCVAPRLDRSYRSGTGSARSTALVGVTLNRPSAARLSSNASIVRVRGERVCQVWRWR